MSLPCADKKLIELLAIGGVLVEFSKSDAGQPQQRVSGDVFNTVLAASQLGHKTALVTAIGQDEHTLDIEQALASAAVDTQWCVKDKTRSNGCYWQDLDSTDPTVRFVYQRSNSAASALQPSAIDWPEVFAQTRWVYFTGISQAVMAGFDWLVLLQQAKAQGCKVAYDPNYRSNLWPSADDALAAMMVVLTHCDAFLPSLDDLQGLVGIDTAEEALHWLSSLVSIPEVVVLKAAEQGHWQIENRTVVHTPAPATLAEIVGAGDRLNAQILLSTTPLLALGRDSLVV